MARSKVLGYWIGATHYPHRNEHKKPKPVLKKIPLRESKESVNLKGLKNIRANYYLIHAYVLIYIMSGETLKSIRKRLGICDLYWYRFHHRECEDYYQKDIREAMRLRALMVAESLADKL
jgi:hypothetical protein